MKSLSRYLIIIFILSVQSFVQTGQMQQMSQQIAWYEPDEIIVGTVKNSTNQALNIQFSDNTVMQLASQETKNLNKIIKIVKLQSWPPNAQQSLITYYGTVLDISMGNVNSKIMITYTRYKDMPTRDNVKISILEYDGTRRLWDEKAYYSLLPSRSTHYYQIIVNADLRYDPNTKPHFTPSTIEVINKPKE